MVRVRFSAATGDNFPSTALRPALGPQWISGTISLRTKLLKSEADQLRRSDAEVKNGGAIPQIPDMSSCRGAQLIKHRDNFTYLLPVEKAREVSSK
jgi:hypothetical protein